MISGIVGEYNVIPCNYLLYGKLADERKEVFGVVGGRSWTSGVNQ